MVHYLAFIIRLIERKISKIKHLRLNQQSLFMSIAKEQIRQIISKNDISNVNDGYELLRDGFKDILQELLEAEMDAALDMRKTKRAIPIRITNAADIHLRI